MVTKAPDIILDRLKRPAEEFGIEWDFVNDLGVGDTLKGVSGGNSAITAKKIDDDSDVSGTFLQGATQSGTKLLVQIQGGLSGKTYDVLFHAATNNGDIFERVVRVHVRD